jgi:hypothetical protein
MPAALIVPKLVGYVTGLQQQGGGHAYITARAEAAFSQPGAALTGRAAGS